MEKSSTMPSKTRTANLLNRLIKQLDTLVPFLGLTQDPVYKLVQSHETTWFTAEQRGTIPRSFGVFETQITHGAFLLGYSYSEAFLADLMRQVYLARPRMLPKDSEMKYSDIRDFRSFKAVIAFLTEKEITELFFRGMDEVAEYFDQKLGLKWKPDEKTQAIVASRLRNCMIHNAAIADRRLAAVSHYSPGDTIRLRASDVHAFGIMMRDLARSLWEQAKIRHLHKRK
jgi:hypothetical protein